RTMLNECLGYYANFGDLANKITRKIDNVRTDVAEGARSGFVRSQSPDERKIWIDNPVLRITRAKMKDAIANFATLDHLFRHRYCRDAPIVMTNHVHDARILHRAHHFLGLRQISGERLFAQN